MPSVIEKLRTINIPNSKENSKINWPLTKADVSEKARADRFIKQFKVMNRSPEQGFYYRYINGGKCVAIGKVSIDVDASPVTTFSDYALTYIENEVSAVILADNPKLGKSAYVSVDYWSYDSLTNSESIKIKIALAN